VGNSITTRPINQRVLIEQSLKYNSKLLELVAIVTLAVTHWHVYNSWVTTRKEDLNANQFSH
jgi:hypothetical protein